MKVGIMSMQRIDNYGSFLQAYGLKKLIEQNGHAVCFVDFHVTPILLEKKYKNLWLYRTLKKILRPVDLDVVSQQTPYFRNAYPALGIDRKRTYRQKVDTLVIGSDEVFNFIQDNCLVGYAPELLGAHSKAKKIISYAASCGNLTMEKVQRFRKTRLAKKCLQKFDAISVRDKNTENFVTELTGKKPQRHLDPVLVFDFSSCIVDSVKIENYILVYGYENRFSAVEGEKIKQFAKESGKRLVAFGGRQPFCDEYIICSPFEILAYFQHADCIITDTFHGTIFSIICHKPFLTISRSDAKVGYGNENKLLSLLNCLHLTQRRLCTFDHLRQQMEHTIDYAAVDAIRKEERHKTMEYLQSNL